MGKKFKPLENQGVSRFFIRIPRSVSGLVGEKNHRQIPVSCAIFLLFRRKNNKKHQNNGVFSKKGQVKKITALVINFTA
jgi:hypothetical protein